MFSPHMYPVLLQYCLHVLMFWVGGVNLPFVKQTVHAASTKFSSIRLVMTQVPPWNFNENLSSQWSNIGGLHRRILFCGNLPYWKNYIPSSYSAWFKQVCYANRCSAVNVVEHCHLRCAAHSEIAQSFGGWKCFSLHLCCLGVGMKEMAQQYYI